MTNKSLYMSLFSEPAVYGIMLTFVAFLYLTFNPTLASIYGFMIIADGFIYLTRNNKIHFNSVSNNTVMAIALAVGVFAAFSGAVILITAAFQSFFQVTPSFASVLSNNMIAAAQPILAQSKILGFIVWGLIIPLIETRLIIRLMELFAEIFNINLSLNNFKTYLLFTALAGGAIWFHISAKGVTGNVALLVTGVFFFVTCALAVYSKEMESAIYLHQINNSAAMLKLLRII